MGDSADRDHHIVLFGATGFVGRLIARHLAREAPGGVRVALAGRDRGRLEAVRAELPAPATGWPMQIVDAADAASLEAMARSTRVVLTTVGPYLRSGFGVARACADTGTGYADLTGEVLFVRETVGRLQDAAAATGARIVHACGFDSVPSDLGVWLTAQAAAADGAGELTGTTLRVRRLRGAVSGGTVASGIGMVDAIADDPDLGRVAGDPNALLPAGAPRLRSDRVVLEKDAERRVWAVPFFMGGFNRQIVNRSNALAGYDYGRAFSYREMQDVGAGARGVGAALGLSAAAALGRAALGFRPARAALGRVLPGPGAGPSERTLARGAFEMEVVADTTSGARYATTVAADADPGYAGTAIMIGEAALALALDVDELPDRAGVLTPATAFGDVLVRRLRRHGFRFETVRR